MKAVVARIIAKTSAKATAVISRRLNVKDMMVRLMTLFLSPITPTGLL